MKSEVFHFKKFDIDQTGSPVKVGTDGVLLASWMRLHDAESALDIGTGTGVIAVMLAQRSEGLTRICGVEIEERACERAVFNAKESPWSHRLMMHHASIQDFVKTQKKCYDLIVTNPPFFRGSTLSQDPDRNRIRHSISLTYKDLLDSVGQLLCPCGFFNIILPGPEGIEFEQKAEKSGLFITRKTKVFSLREKPVERLLLEFSRSPVSDPDQDELVIHRSKDRGFTWEYRNLTRDFYLKF